MFNSVQFSGSVVSDSAAPWTAALQTSLSITNSWSLLKLMSIESVMPCNHLLGLKPSQNPGNCFQDQMKLKFLMSHHRKNSVRDEVMGKKWIYSDSKRSTLHRVWAIAEGSAAAWLQCGMVSFYGLGNFI